MSKTQPTTEELPKKKIAKKVITPKHLYFLPDQGTSVEAESVEDAVAKANNSKQVKEGDDRS